ncbi:MAG TPA: hypothetical protein ENJ31_11985 [Anaerolineae bacterium]|nr:hypothetical protein [Anaerolineae bacterium]
MQLKKRQAQAVLDKLHMQVRSTHHKMGTFVYEGRPILRTRVSFGRGDIPGPVVARFRGQLKLNEQQFRELIKCPLDYDGYVEILKEKGYIPE